MIYIGKFLHATNQQETDESERRHGEFNLIVEADNQDTAVDAHREAQRGPSLLRQGLTPAACR